VTTAVTAYDISLTLHIVAAIIGFGAGFAQAITIPVALGMDARHLPYVHRLHVALNSWLASPALAIVVATGFYQVADGDWDLGDAWLSATLAIVIVIGGLTGAYFIPADRRLAAMAERELAAAGGGEVQLSAEYQRGARNTGIVGALTGVLVIAAVYLMVTKPGL
jgi:uncharacterized membrane protein